MTVPSLGKFLVPATLAAGAVFSILTAPLALFGSSPVEVQVQGAKVFEGTLKDIATPYLGLAGVLSLGVGITSISVVGWRHSARQFEKVGQQLSGTQQQLHEKEAQLQTLFFSDKNLEATGLEFFLEDESPVQQLQPAQSSIAASQPIVQTEAHTVQPRVFSATPGAVTSKATLAPQMTVHAAVSPLYAAQAFLSFSRSGTPAAQATWTEVAAPADNGLAIAQINDLQDQLQHILSQIETLQGNLHPQSLLSHATSSELISTAASLKHRLQKAEPQRVMQVVAS